MNRGKKLFSDVLLFTLSNFGSKVLVFLLVPLYTSTLSTEEYGIADLMTVTIHLLFPLLTVGITEATLRFLLDKDSKKDKILTISTAVIVISTLLVSISLPIIIKIKPDLSNYGLFFLVMYFTSALNTCFSNYTRGIDRTKVFAIKGILYTALMLAFNILFLVVFKIGLEGYLLSIIISDVLTVIYMIIAAKEYKYFKLGFDISLTKEMLKYSLPMIPTILAWWVMQVSDKYIVIAFSGIAVSGIYAVSYKIPSILSLITTIFNQAWQISAVKSYEDDDYKDFFKRVYKLFFVGSIALSSVLILSSQLLGKILFANDYYVAWHYVPFLVIAYLFSGLSGVMASAFTTIKKTSVLLYSTLAGAAFNIVFNFVFIPKYGAMAAATTTMLGFLLTFIIRECCLRKKCGMKLTYIKEILALLLILAEALAMVMDYSWKYIAASVLLLLIIILNFKSLIDSLRLLKSLVVKILKHDKKHNSAEIN